MLTLTQPTIYSTPAPTIKFSTFPDNSAYVKVNEVNLDLPVIITYLFDGDASFIQLLLVTDAIRRLGVTDIHLRIPYMPGARCDRVNAKNMGEALGAAVYASMLNTQGYKTVTIIDPHSDVTPALINNVRVIAPADYFANVLAALNADDYKSSTVLISPDAGALKKVEILGERYNIPVINAFKKRDVATGKLVPGSCVLHADPAEILGKVCIICDDICSRGGTFIPIATKLKEQGAAKVYLSVSHFEGHDNKQAFIEAGIDGVFSATQLKPMSDGNFYRLSYDINS